MPLPIDKARLGGRRRAHKVRIAVQKRENAWKRDLKSLRVVCPQARRGAGGRDGNGGDDEEFLDHEFGRGGDGEEDGGGGGGGVDEAQRRPRQRRRVEQAATHVTAADLPRLEAGALGLGWLQAPRNVPEVARTDPLDVLSPRILALAPGAPLMRSLWVPETLDGPKTLRATTVEDVRRRAAARLAREGGWLPHSVVDAVVDCCAWTGVEVLVWHVAEVHDFARLGPSRDSFRFVLPDGTVFYACNLAFDNGREQALFGRKEIPPGARVSAAAGWGWLASRRRERGAAGWGSLPAAWPPRLAPRPARSS